MQEHFTPSEVRKIDTGQVYNAYRDWPELARAGFRVKFEPAKRVFRRAFVLGMGGSAAGGDIIAGWLSPRRDLEFSVFKGHIPLSGMKDSIAIACSASGQTPETISMVKTATQSHATVVCISSGGKLREEAKSLGLQHLSMPKVVAPRYMLPFIVFSCLAVLNDSMRLECEDEANESISELGAMSNQIDIETASTSNSSKQLAEKLLHSTPAVLGDTVTRGVGIRFKNVMNENAKRHAYFDMMPDLFHNEVQAWEHRDDGFLPVFLRHTAEGAAEKKKADAMTKLLAGLGNTPVEARGKGEGILSQLMTMVYHLDMTSYYVAIGLGRNPLKTDLIDGLKKES